jgi:hypothetical protein
LFVNQDKNYSLYVQQVFARFEAASLSGEFLIDYNRIQKYENYALFFLIKEFGNELTELKVELVNDIAFHYGGLIRDPVIGVTDSWQNILSNKLSAVFRYEAKDIADIWIIARHKMFAWPDVIQEAKTKEGGTDPIVIFNILKSFPEQILSTIKWIIPVDPLTFRKELDQIADDILEGTENRLI